MNHVVGNKNLAVIRALDDAPFDQGGNVFVDPLHVTLKRAGKSANSGRSDLLQCFDQFQRLGLMTENN